MFQVQNLIHSGFAGEQDRGRLLLLAGLLLIDLSRGGETGGDLDGDLALTGDFD